MPKLKKKWALGLILVLALASRSGSAPANVSEEGAPPSGARAAQEAYQQAKKAFENDPKTKAVAFARSTFDLAEFAQSDSERARQAEEGIAAARQAVKGDPNSASAHYYLAMNLGQLARTKSLGALKLVKEMEQEFLKAIDLDPKVDHAGPERSLGQLYRDAPGWPTSIGSKSKARAHLQKAIEIAPEFPDNQLSMMEALVKWRDRLALQRAISTYRSDVLPKAKAKYSGSEWQSAWEDWGRSFQEILAKSQRLEHEGNRGSD